MSSLRTSSVFCGIFREPNDKAHSTIARGGCCRLASRINTGFLGGYSRCQHIVLGDFMLDDEEDEARAIGRIVHIETGETVGLVYVWEDGARQPFWFGTARKGVVVEDLQKTE